jgi:hypothetical protein
VHIPKLANKTGTCEQVVLLGYSNNDMPTLVELPFEFEFDHYLIKRATQKIFDVCKIKYTSLARHRFIQKGFNAFKDFGILNESENRDLEDPIVLEEFCLNISRSWIFDGVKVNTEDVYGWVQQFKKRGFVVEGCQLLLYLKREGFVTQNAVKGNLLRLYKEHVAKVDKNVTVITIQPLGKSESLFSYALSIEAKFKDLGDVLKMNNSPEDAIELVCFDDVIVSGGSVLKYLFNTEYNPHSELLKKAFAKNAAHLTVIVSHADKYGITKIIDDPRCNNSVSVKASFIVDDSRRIFSANSIVLTDKSNIKKFSEFCQEMGAKVTSSVPPLGWNGAEWCIVFDYSVPNGTIPVIWAGSNKNKWAPLFHRKRTPAK